MIGGAKETNNNTRGVKEDGAGGKNKRRGVKKEAK